ncbi:glycosyltransferase family 1 protein [Microbacterium sp. cx-59]|uniref:glycosyltransferase family 4 protein n=1 Tax=Microbacterium sp. cx-59 TaxID=2891207 RepID=UPI001E2E7758|nr:glycosyltransferase family 1 protein [Microbacterium sp. cx-59]MCC4907844.1 glycosyltransferase family 4 protein [Microbacterium sp. cx-59]
MPRVLVDLLFFTGKQGGTETVAREVYSRFFDRPGWEFVGYASSELYAKGADWFPGRLIDSGLTTTKRAQWAFGEVTGVARAARATQADLIHSPANFGPPRTRVPLVLTLHDALAFKHPEFLPSRVGVIPTQLLIRSAARSAAHIVTDSVASQNDIVDLLGIPAERVSVVMPGSSGARPSGTAERAPDRLFTLGNRMPHKNFPRLIEALALIPEDRRPVLTISGSHAEDPLTAVVAEHSLEKWVQLRSWLEREEVDDLYATSTAVVFPTLFEGFGLPALEAMERGCPVICSDIPVLREVAGDAAAYFDPTDAAAMADAIQSALRDPAGLARNAELGLERATLFSWDRTADELLAVFDDVARTTRGR